MMLPGLQCLEIPDQIVDEAARKAECFPSENGRVEDPVALLEEEDSQRPWTPEEKRIFMDKFLAYPKVRLPLLPVLMASWHVLP